MGPPPVAPPQTALTMAAEQAVDGLGAQLVHDRQEAIGEIYVALGSTVRSYLQGLVGHDDADDILQRVFYEVWQHNRRYDPSRSLTAWILGIARKRAIDHLRRPRNIAVALHELGDVAGEDGRELAERYARAHEVRDALTRLPDEQREVLVLAYFGRFTQTEIAAYLDVPLGTVKARAFRGLRRLAQFLDPGQQVTESAQFVVH
jgi:RNA polymerase sigma factor (sigma-70 family)